jgi:hypothetical protein
MVSDLHSLTPAWRAWRFHCPMILSQPHCLPENGDHGRRAASASKLSQQATRGVGV